MIVNLQKIFKNIQFNLSAYTLLSHIQLLTLVSTMESLQKLEFEVYKDINSKFSLCYITSWNVEVIVNSVNETLAFGGDIDRAIHETAGSKLLD